MNEEDNLPTPDVHRTSTREGIGVTMSIVSELSDLRGCAPTELEPLAYDVDPEHLDWIVEGAAENKVTFESNGYVVTVYGDGTLIFSPIDG